MGIASILSSCFGNNEPKKKHAKGTMPPPRHDVKNGPKCSAVKGAILSSVHQNVKKCATRPVVTGTVPPSAQRDVKKCAKRPIMTYTIYSSVGSDVEKCVKRPIMTCNIHSLVRPNIEKCIKRRVITSTVPPPTQCNLKICVKPNSECRSGARANDGATKQAAAISTTIQIPVTLPCTINIKNS
ncbi:uncharacterized protein LOC111370338 [Olea europaea var. sylvestris]|uniref:uncharacterized protein LOC111370338 n=1 Tax=Olea europaea var. sylvestris TaxID=158386 RepID=UPI000C1D69A8|nr:uncharacterized protein LOC111370338 [Olea europaea var. sylvestris]